MIQSVPEWVKNGEKVTVVASSHRHAVMWASEVGATPRQVRYAGNPFNLNGISGRVIVLPDACYHKNYDEIMDALNAARHHITIEHVA